MKKRLILMLLFFACSTFSLSNALGYDYVVLGKSQIFIPDTNSVVGTQVDRVFRDIHWDDPKFGPAANPWRVIRSKDDVVPYMEGRLVGELIEYAHVKVVPLLPTEAILDPVSGRYYAKDADGGVERFEIDPSKTEYKTVEFSKNHRRAVMVDTHGFNMVAWRAVKLSKINKLDLVIACMDLPAKAKAALFLAKQDINCYGPCDRFLCDLIGWKDGVDSKATILGTAPIRKIEGGAVIGNQPIKISLYEAVIAQTTNRPYPDQYCDTPGRYFKALVEKYGLDDFRVDLVTANVGETNKLVSAARERDVWVIGARVYNEQDAEPLKEWLLADNNHRLILFHSAPYTFGYNLFFEFPNQVGFGDPSPVFK